MSIYWCTLYSPKASPTGVFGLLLPTVVLMDLAGQLPQEDREFTYSAMRTEWKKRSKELRLCKNQGLGVFHVVFWLHVPFTVFPPIQNYLPCSPRPPTISLWWLLQTSSLPFHPPLTKKYLGLWSSSQKRSYFSQKLRNQACFAPSAL